MGKRLSKIVTRTGDQGETGLGDGSRLSKDDLIVHCMGEVDELNSWIGMVRAALPEEDEFQAPLNQIQHDLFDLGGELAMPGYDALNPDMVIQLDEKLEQLNQHLPALKDFILPGGDEVTARLHMARTVARRAERALVSLLRSDSLDEIQGEHLSLQYLNRLSDLLFVMARAASKREGAKEFLWQSRRVK